MAKRLFYPFDRRDREGVLADLEFYIVFSVAHTVFIIGVCLIMGARVALKDRYKSFPLILGDERKELLGKFHLQALILNSVCKARYCIVVAIGEGEVRLYIVDGRAVKQVRTRNDQDQPLGGLLYPDKPHRGKSDRIRAVGRSGGKNAHSTVAAKARGSYGWRPAIPLRLRKLPDEPKVGIFLYPSQSLSDSVFGLENYSRFHILGYAALARYAEFFLEIVPYSCDYLHLGSLPFTYSTLPQIFICGSAFGLFEILLLIIRRSRPLPRKLPYRLRSLREVRRYQRLWTA